MTENTRNAILCATLKLFNSDGSASVSTNHIAKAAGISPGNLYYHYRDKAEIIRALLERMITEADDIWDSAPTERAGLEDLRALLAHSLEIVWEYRFFYRELAPLTQSDPLLKRRYTAIRRQRLKQIEDLILAFNAAGEMRGPSGAQLNALVRLSWMVGEFALASAELDGITGKRAPIDQAIKMLFELWRPHVVAE